MFHHSYVTCLISRGARAGHCRCWLFMETRMRTDQSWSWKQWNILTSVCVRLVSIFPTELTTRMPFCLLISFNIFYFRLLALILWSLCLGYGLSVCLSVCLLDCWKVMNGFRWNFLEGWNVLQGPSDRCWWWSGSQL